MFQGGGFFAFSNAGPLLLLFFGAVVIGAFTSAAAILIRLRADSELTSGESQQQIDTSIIILVISSVLSIVGAYLYHWTTEYGTGMLLAIVGIFLLWPLSAVFGFRGRGAGREVLVVGHGLIAVLMVMLLLCILVHSLL
jgi:hypothetical protein